MLSARSRAILDRYMLSSRAVSRQSGERSSREPGQSVEFHDFRPYQAGDELRYVDWRVYARTGRLYTRLYQAERAVKLHLVLDNSASMSIGLKADYARTLVQLLSYVAQRDAPTQVHLLGGGSSKQAQGAGGMRETWRFVEEAPVVKGPESGALGALKRFAIGLPSQQGSGLALVVSDLFEDAPIRPALTALKARGMDIGFLHVVAAEDLEPPAGLLELHELETGGRLPAGPDEVRAYRDEVQRYLERTRNAVLRAGFKHVLLRCPARGSPETSGDRLERDAFAALIRSAVLVKR